MGAAVGFSYARTYSGQGRIFTWRSRKSCQLSGHSQKQGQTVYKNRRLSLRWFEPNTCHHMRKRPASCMSAAMRAVSCLSRGVSSHSAADRCVAGSTDVWRTAPVPPGRSVRTVGFSRTATDGAAPAACPGVTRGAEPGVHPGGRPVCPGGLRRADGREGRVRRWRRAAVRNAV